MNETWNSHKKLNILSYLALALFLTACDLPDLEGEDPNALVEFSPNLIDEVLAPELNKVSLNQIKVGDMVEYKTTYVAETGSKNSLEDRKRTVKVSEWVYDTDGDLVDGKVVMDYKKVDHNDNKNSFTRDEIWKFEGSNIMSAKALQSFFPFDDDEPVVKVKFYNFNTRRRVVTPPKSILDKDNCGGLIGCTITGIDIQYIVHLVKDGVVVERQKIREFVSHQIPALFVIDSQSPYDTLLPVAESCKYFLFEGIYVNMCTVISDLDIK